MRQGAFPDPDEPVDDGGLAKARMVVLRPAPERVVCAPSLAARQTAQALGLATMVEQALADIDHGAWRGLSLPQVEAAEGQALMRWIMNPASGAPGGEAFASVRARMANWMEVQATTNQRILAITHPTVIRAALAHVLDIPDAAAFRIDVAPLCGLILSFDRQWRFQGLGGEGVKV
jgi:broad specificity phosphatase PhoE